MSELITFYHSDLVDALYYFEYHTTLYKYIKWIPRDKEVYELYKLIRKIKFPSFKYFINWIRNIAAQEEIESPKKLANYVVKNPPRRKTAEKWIQQQEKMADILQEIYNLYTKKILDKAKKNELEKLRKQIEKKYRKIWDDLKKESEKLPGIIWKRKEPKICLLYPLDGRLSHKLKFAQIAYIETSKTMLENEALFLHEIVKLLNNTSPITKWVRQDRRGIRAIAYELFTHMQTLKLVQSIFKKKPNFRNVILDRLESLWIPNIRPETDFDEDELERILSYSYKNITNHQFEALYQLGELYTELNIILLA